MKKLSALIALAAALSAPAWAATKTVTLSVPGMTCAACPITVKKALTKDGVQKGRGQLRETGSRRDLRRREDQRRSLDKGHRERGLPRYREAVRA